MPGNYTSHTSAYLESGLGLPFNTHTHTHTHTQAHTSSLTSTHNILSAKDLVHTLMSRLTWSKSVRGLCLWRRGLCNILWLYWLVLTFTSAQSADTGSRSVVPYAKSHVSAAVNRVNVELSCERGQCVEAQTCFNKKHMNGWASPASMQVPRRKMKEEKEKKGSRDKTEIEFSTFFRHCW